MRHWQDGRRGALSPYPQPPGSNDLSSRLSRLEVHQWHTAQDLHRIETESLLRGQDLRAEISTIRDRIRAVEMNIGTAWRLASYTPKLLRFLAAAVLFGLVLSGKISPDAMKVLLSALGLSPG